MTQSQLAANRHSLQSSAGSYGTSNGKFRLPSYLIGAIWCHDYRSYKVEDEAEFGVQAAFGLCDWQPSKRGTDKIVCTAWDRPKQFLDRLKYLCRFRGLIWVVCWESPVVIVESGILDAIESGEIVFSKPKEVRRRQSGKNCHSGFRGLLVDNDPPIILSFQFRDVDAVVNLVDVRNYLPITVEELASWGEIRVNGTGPVSKSTGPKSYTPTHLARKIVAYMSDFCWTAGDLGCQSLHKTLPAQAWNLWIKGDGKDVLKHHDSPGLTVLEKWCNYGGRRQALYTGDIDGDVYHVDVNSMYPFLAQTLEVPYEHCNEFPDGPTMQTTAKCSEPVTLSECIVNTTKPCLPCRTERGIEWPVGTFTTLLCGPELDYAQANNCIVLRKREWRYKCDRILANYSHNLLLKRGEYTKQGKVASVKFIKHINNTFYGKFAQNLTEWIDCIHLFPLEPWGRWYEDADGDGKLEECRGIGYLGQYQKQIYSPGVYFPLVASFVTAAGRVFMQRLIDEMPDESVYYVGVDSLLCSRSGYDHLCKNDYIDATKPGSLKLHGIYTRLHLTSGSCYRHDSGFLACGIPQDCVRTNGTQYTFHKRSQFRSIMSKRQESVLAFRNETLDLDTHGTGTQPAQRGWLVPTPLAQGDLMPWRDDENNANLSRCACPAISNTSDG